MVETHEVNPLSKSNLSSGEKNVTSSLWGESLKQSSDGNQGKEKGSALHFHH